MNSVNVLNVINCFYFCTAEQKHLILLHLTLVKLRHTSEEESKSDEKAVCAKNHHGFELTFKKRLVRSPVTF